MKHTSKLLSAFLALQWFASCEKDDEPEPSGASGEPLLVRTKSYRLGQTDTTSWVYEYDSQNRISKRKGFSNGIEQPDNTAISFSGNFIYSTATDSPYPGATMTYADTTELDNFKMPIKKLIAMTYEGGSSINVYKRYERTKIEYEYDDIGFFQSQTTYSWDSTKTGSNGTDTTMVHIDTTVIVLTIENENIKTVKTDEYSNYWTNENGNRNFSRFVSTWDEQYEYSKNYSNHPVSEVAGQYALYQLYWPFIYFSTRKNFKNLPDRITSSYHGGTHVINYKLTYTDKGYLNTVEWDYPNGFIVEYYYK